jgi:hypothetical protein
MAASMSTEHLRLMEEAVGSNDSTAPGARLLRQCRHALSSLEADKRRWPYNLIPAEVACAMPPTVADVYLAHPGAIALHDCEDCGYEVPHEYFERCPLCGGRIGWYAFWNKHKDDPRPSAEAAAGPV